MPPPPVFFVGIGVIATVAFGLAFKEFIYEPFVAPRLEQWAEAFVNHRRERRRESVPPFEAPFDHSRRRPPSGSPPSEPPTPDGLGGTPSLELQDLVAHERNEWRGNIRLGEGSQIRHRRPVSTDMVETTPFMPSFNPIRPTHVLFDSSPGTSTAEQSPSLTPVRSRPPSPSPFLDRTPSLPNRPPAQFLRSSPSANAPLVTADPPAPPIKPEDFRPLSPASTLASSMSPSASAYGAASRSAFASPVMRTVSPRVQSPPPIARSDGTRSPPSPSTFASARQWQAEVARHEPLGSPSAVASTLGSPPMVRATLAPSDRHGPSTLGLVPSMPRSPFSDAMSTWSEIEHPTTQDEPRSAGRSSRRPSIGSDDDVEVISGVGSWHSVRKD